MDKKYIGILGVIVFVIIILLIGTSGMKSGTTDQVNLGTTNSPTPQAMELKIEDTKEGTGSAVKSGDTISINYRGILPDGTEFDSSYKRGTPFETQIGVGQVIKGWDEGVIGMKVGGKRKLTIPPDKAYGPNGIPGSIPPNATLIFEVELTGIK